MSNYPAGAGHPRRHSVTVECSPCGERWTATIRESLGFAELLPPDDECPTCGARGSDLEVNP